MTMLGIPFEDHIQPFAADSNYHAFRSFSPTGQVPVLVDSGLTIWDSLGIT
jgi:glutathione S-transferase